MKQLSEYLIESIDGERIFTIIKPGFLEHAQDIIEMFKKEGFKVNQTAIKTLTRDEAAKLYKVHSDEDFFEELCDYMSSGPSRAIIYSRPGKTSDSTFETVTKLKDKIRERWGIDKCKNVMHSSDSLSAQEHESVTYF